MDKNTPPKHKTPNFKLVRHSVTRPDFIGRDRTIVWHRWEPVPLRRNRKDLAA